MLLADEAKGRQHSSWCRVRDDSTLRIASLLMNELLQHRLWELMHCEINRAALAAKAKLAVKHLECTESQVGRLLAIQIAITDLEHAPAVQGQCCILRSSGRIQTS